MKYEYEIGEYFIIVRESFDSFGLTKASGDFFLLKHRASTLQAGSDYHLLDVWCT